MTYNIVKGGRSTDSRGEIRYVNDLDMSKIKRFYFIRNSDLSYSRGWRAHRIEQRWFFVTAGEFEVNLVVVDNWERPNKELPVEKIYLKSDDIQILHLQAGVAVAFKALEENSEMMVLSDYPLSHAALDNYTYDRKYFVNL